MSLRSRFLTRLRDRVTMDRLPLRITFWDGEVFEFAAKPQVTIALHTPRLMRCFLTGDIAGLGRAHAEGEIDVEGRLQDILQVGIALAERLGKSSPLRVLGRLLGWRRHTIAGNAAAVRYHYDVSNDFYRLWLDRNMVYS